MEQSCEAFTELSHLGIVKNGDWFLNINKYIGGAAESLLFDETERIANPMN